MPKMVKVDIVRAVQLQMQIHFGEAELLVNEVLDFMKDALEDGEDVLITGLGRFELREKQPRPGRDPKSKKAYEITERRVVTFHPSKIWRDELNDNA
jgi:integration host factor subunit alpha